MEHFEFVAPHQISVSVVVIIDEYGNNVWQDCTMGVFNFSPGDMMTLNFAGLGL